MTIHDPGEPGRPPPLEFIRHIVPGAPVISSDGEKLGEVAAVNPDYLTVTKGLLFPTESAIPLALVAGIDRGRVFLMASKAELQAQRRDLPQPSPTLVDDPSMRPPTTDATATAQMRPGQRARADDQEQVLELWEERLVPETQLRQVGEIHVRTEVEQVPGRLEIEAVQEEIDIERVPVGRPVSERQAPWEDGEVLVVPVYEEQLVVVKRLVLKEELRIRRVKTTERRLIEELLRRERAVIEDPERTGLVSEHVTMPDDIVTAESDEPRDQGQDDDNELGRLARKLLF